jgi:hypothetical protein
MKGFIVNTKGGTYRIGSDSGIALLCVNILKDRRFMEAGGIAFTGMPDGHFEVGDEIEIEIAEFDKASEPIDQTGWTPPVIDEAEVLAGELEEYRKLKSILMKEGLLTEDDS